jgi:Domain of unknown function (DUF929)
MVDWEFVDRRHAAGKSWEEIASDRRADFVPDPNGPSPGRQLRALSRERGSAGPVGETPVTGGPPSRSSRLARVGWFIFPMMAPWAFLAIVLPSPFGVYLPGIPTLGLVAAIAGIVLAIGLLKTHPKWNRIYRQTAMIGFAVGLLIVSGLGAAAWSNGCPVLSPFTTAEPGGWVRVAHANWAVEGVPVLFFYGSVACPYCSASSWAVLTALQRLGTVSGVSYDHSSSTDVYPNTPSVILPDLTVASSYVSLDALESLDNSSITAPSPGACIEQAYLSAYNPFGAIPFVVIGGTFVHASATLVDPAALQGLTAVQVEEQLTTHQGSAYVAISGAEAYLLAYLVYLNGREPSSVATDPAVAPILGQIS